MSLTIITIPNKNYDKDLNPVLENASNDDLGVLVDYLKKKLSEDLTSSEVYKRYSPNHQKYYGVIAKEIRDMGGNSFANAWRKQGPTYQEIVYDVAKKLKADVSQIDAVVVMENAIMEKVLKQAIGKMSEEEQLSLVKELGYESLSKGGTATMIAIQAFRMGGFKSYQLTLIVANQIARLILGRGLMLTTNAAIARWASILTGPIGWVIGGAWTAVDVAGPAYSVTIPCVIHIAMLRKKQSMKTCSNCQIELGDATVKFCPECGEKQ